METIFLLLSGVILFAGVIYWMWSHIQLTQKKVQLLENAVFELRAMIPPGGGTAGPPQTHSVPASLPIPVKPAAPAYTDLADDDWDSDAVGAPVREVSTPLETLSHTPASTPATDTAVPELITREMEVSDDLMPGGRIQLGSGEQAPDEKVIESGPSAEETFKQLLQSRAMSSSASSDAPALEGMPLKELRRLGEQRGIRGAAEMRKKELLTALRSQVPAVKKEEQRTLDLAIVEAEAAAEAAAEAGEEGDVVEPAASESGVAEEAEILE